MHRESVKKQRRRDTVNDNSPEVKTMAIAEAEVLVQSDSTATVKQICFEEGADDVGFVEIGRESLLKEREGVLRVYPKTRTIISIIRAMNRENIQSPARYVANDEFHRTDDYLSEISRRVLCRLNELGIRGVALTEAFPMDMNRWPGKIWDVSHKTIAVEAGLGHVGTNRLVIQPKHGNFIVLNSILIDSALDQYDTPLPENPCIECHLCVSVCPTGAISKDKPFDFMACSSHSYRNNMVGFQQWVETIIAAGDVSAYRSRYRDSETASMWQSLMYRMDYKCGYCMAVCPAGEGVQSRYLTNKKAYVKEIVKPLKNKAEPVYVVAGSEAESAAKRNPNKQIRHIPASAERQMK